ncbi:sugar ABC transporter permease [Georgenia satyanarayanai]|uniref:carbohydrate ABC transporter permease n=1 Tax=Georgenia satyanarayanai TaxID=860221 RepID=UPI00203EDBA3|nr:sugar ABC transporter permease [Georgenia satyanarayanai]MCM3661342.1 sugar ABC transporter permease [Georgenia satyanarayanai]
MLFVLPASLFIFVFMLYPLLHSGYLSFTEYNFVYDESPRFVGLDNYTSAFQDAQFLTSLRNTLVYAIFYFTLVTGASFGLALLLFRKLRLSSFYRSAIFMPIVVPLSLAGLIFVWILQPNYGLLNHVLGNVLGLEGLTRAWLSSGGTAMAAVVGLSLWATVGFMTILFLSGLQAIPQEVLEAAEMDGASGWRRTLYIVMPNLRPTFVIAGTWAILQALKVFVEPMVLTDGGPGTSTLVLYQQVYLTAFSFYEMGYASAMGYILGVIILAFIGLNYFVTMRKAGKRA